MQEAKEETMIQSVVVDIITKPLNVGTSFARGAETLTIPDILVRYKMIAIFFGASWCIITQDFINHLRAFYEEVNLEDKELEIVFVGLDKNQQEFKKFTAGMPWLTIPFGDVRISDLKQFYRVRSLPQVLALQANGDPIMTNGRQDVYKGGEETFTKWTGMKAEI